MLTVNQVGSDTMQRVITDSRNDVMGKDDFLKLLVTQLNYQDPLDPMDNQEFSAQLAQFSALEQLHNVNANLENGLKTDASLERILDRVLSASFIGREIKAYGTQITLTSGRSDAIEFDLTDRAAHVVIDIGDASGNAVATLELGDRRSGHHEFSWDGKDHFGNIVPDGIYTYTVRAVDVEGSQVPVASYITGEVQGVSYQKEGQAVLIIEGRKVPLDQVLEVRKVD